MSHELSDRGRLAVIDLQMAAEACSAAARAGCTHITDPELAALCLRLRQELAASYYARARRLMGVVE